MFDCIARTPVQQFTCWLSTTVTQATVKQINGTSVKYFRKGLLENTYF